MQIKTITCSDPREDTSITKLVAFMNAYPNVEIAVQATPSKIAPGTARRAWFDTLMHLVRNNPKKLNLAMHVNSDYCRQMCLGNVPVELGDWMAALREDGTPVIGRWQINFSGCKDVVFDYANLVQVIKNFADREFIMQYDSSVLNGAHLMRLRANMTIPTFSVLYDRSGGNGISPDQWPHPYPGINTGYSGGLRPENISDQLNKIADVAGNATIWIDAEGGLKTPGTKSFDFARARAYVNSANKWCENNR